MITNIYKTFDVKLVFYSFGTFKIPNSLDLATAVKLFHQCLSIPTKDTVLFLQLFDNKLINEPLNDARNQLLYHFISEDHQRMDNILGGRIGGDDNNDSDALKGDSDDQDNIIGGSIENDDNFDSDTLEVDSDDQDKTSHTYVTSFMLLLQNQLSFVTLFPLYRPPFLPPPNYCLLSAFLVKLM